jgi:hypothetical protein
MFQRLKEFLKCQALLQIFQTCLYLTLSNFPDWTHVNKTLLTRITLYIYPTEMHHSTFCFYMMQKYYP